MHVRTLPHTVHSLLLLGAALSAGCAGDGSAEEPELDTLAQLVVAGSTEPDAHFPWVVRVSGSLSCHGTLLEPRWVLTAAHCVDRSFGGVNVSYRRSDPATGRTSGTSQDTGASSVVVHPEYDPFSGANDLALVHLRTPLDSELSPDPLLQPAELPSAGSWQGSAALVASTVRHGSTLPAGNTAVLRGTIFSDGSTLLYAKSPTASLCPGDSGSGLVVQQSGRNLVVGVASQSANATLCDRPDQEFVATNVGAYVDWIHSHTGLQTPYRHVALSARSQAPAAVSSPVGLSFPALGVTNVVYRDSSGRLRELWEQGGTSGTSDLTGLAGAPSAAGEPSAFLSSDGLEVALYRSSNGQVHSLYWNTGAVGHDALSAAAGAPATSGTPVGYTTPDGVTHVIYRTSNGQLEELWWQGLEAPGAGALLPVGAPAAASDPIAYANPRSNESIVVYRGTDSHIHSLYWSTGAVGHDNLSGYAGSPSASGKPAGYYRAGDDSHQITYRASDGQLYELWWNGAAAVQAWSLTAAAGAPAAASDPTAFYSAATHSKHVVYRGVDGHLHALAWTPGGGVPAHADLSFEAAAPAATGTPSGFSVEATRTQHVVYRGSDGQVHEIRWRLP